MTVSGHATPATMGDETLGQVRRIVFALPTVNERLSHGEPCFFVRDMRPVCYFPDNQQSRWSHLVVVSDPA